MWTNKLKNLFGIKTSRKEMDAMFYKIQNTCPLLTTLGPYKRCPVTNNDCVKKDCIAYYILKFNWPTPPVNHEEKRKRDGIKPNAKM